MEHMATPLTPVRTDRHCCSSPERSSATGIDAGTAWHYGDPIGEQRAAESGAVLIDRSNRAMLTVTGPIG